MKNLIFIGASGVFVFVGCRMVFFVQVKEKVDPFLVEIHCCAQKTNWQFIALNDFVRSVVVKRHVPILPFLHLHSKSQ
jgi:hypothetical protein